MTAGQGSLRFPLMGIGLLALLAALWGGLSRMGWMLTPAGAALAAAHGPLMVCGFLGTLIGVERAVALRAAWAYAGPVLTALGVVALVAGAPPSAAAACMAAGSAVLIAVFARIVRDQPALFVHTMALGALCWLVGNVLWAGGHPLFDVVSWWIGFLVLTIAGERLELSRMRRLSRVAAGLFLALVVLFLAGLVLGGVGSDSGARPTGLALFGFAVWLLQYDVARRTVRQPGLPRFTAVCLLAGYVWLGAAGVLAVRFGGVIAGLQYDAVLHAVFLGFVFSMIFGHAPIILTAVLGLPIALQRSYYAHLALLHLSLLLRLGGDLFSNAAVRQWGGMLNAIAVLLFVANTARAARGAQRATRSLGQQPAAAERGAA